MQGGQNGKGNNNKKAIIINLWRNLAQKRFVPSFMIPTAFLV